VRFSFLRSRFVSLPVTPKEPFQNALAVAVVGNLGASCSDAGSVAQPLVEKRFKKLPVNFQRA
jgi:hypothetical protein